VGKGWEEFTRALLRALSQRPTPLVFVFLGPKLARYSGEIDTTRHSLVRAPHPEQDTFPGCHLFCRINEALELRGESGIWWQLPAI
jgi:uracil-DNA glycosylase